MPRARRWLLCCSHTSCCDCAKISDICNIEVSHAGYAIEAGPTEGGNAALILALLKISPRDSLRFAVSLNRWVCVCASVDAKNRPIGNLSQWDDLLFGLKATFRSWFIADDGWNELQKSGDSNSRRQIVQLPSQSISAGNLVFVLQKG